MVGIKNQGEGSRDPENVTTYYIDIKLDRNYFLIDLDKNCINISGSLYFQYVNTDVKSTR